MSLHVALYAEGPAEDRGEDCFLPAPGQVLVADQHGPAHNLIARAIEREHRLPLTAIQFQAPARIKAKKVTGSDLHDSKNLRRLMQLAAVHHADVAIVLVDEDGVRDRRRTLQEATQGLDSARVIAVAVREFEAWLLADQRALVSLLPTAPTPPSLEDMTPGAAKSLLAGLLDAGVAGMDQANRARFIRGKRIDLARTVDLSALDKLASFRHFRDDLRQALPARN